MAPTASLVSIRSLVGNAVGSVREVSDSKELKQIGGGIIGYF